MGRYISRFIGSKNSCLRENDVALCDPVNLGTDNEYKRVSAWLTWSSNSRNAVGQSRLALFRFQTVIATNPSVRESKHLNSSTGSCPASRLNLQHGSPEKERLLLIVRAVSAIVLSTFSCGLVSAQTSLSEARNVKT